MDRFKKEIALFFYLVFSTYMAFGQINQFKKALKKTYKKLDIHKYKIDSLLNIYKNSNNDSLQYLYFEYANWLSGHKDLNYAITIQKKAIEFAKKNNPDNIYFIARSHKFLGFYYYNNREYLNAINTLNNSLTINEKPDLFSYDYLAKSHKQIHSYQKAISYYEALRSIIIKSHNNTDWLRDTYINISNVYLFSYDKKNYSKAIRYLKKADSISRTLSKTSPFILYSQNLHLATAYSQPEVFDSNKSFYYYKKALFYAKQLDNNEKVSYTYLWLGHLFRFEDTKKSLKYLNKSLSFLDKNDLKKHNEVYTFIGQTYAYNGEFKKSLEFKFKSIDYLIGRDFKDSQNVKKTILENIKDVKILYFRFSEIAEIYLKYYEKTKNKIFLEESISYFKLADYTVDLLKINSHEFKSRLFWRKISTDIYGKAIRACFLDGDKENAFYFMEKNKALLLIEDMSTQNFRQSLDISATDLEKEKELKKGIFLLENTLEHDLKLKKNDIEFFKKELIDLNRQLLTFQDSIYKNKSQLKIKPKITSLKDVQKDLINNEIFIEYHISIDDGYSIYSNNKNAYAIFITKDHSHFFEIPNQLQLKDNITQLIKDLKSPFKTKNDISSYKAISYAVFNQLFPTNKIKELIKNKKLTIVPDSYLSLVPFEALNTNSNRLDYLINQNEISYLYSNSFLENQNIKEEINSNFIGFAPEKFNYDQLLDLPNSKNEIIQISSYYTGDTFLKEKASKKTFLNQLSNYNIIHLATHANAQDSISPWIAFNDEKLTLQELYLTKNNASLVVLSGCNTSLGKEEIGEGIMSLARGFFYSGSQSIVSSLWSVDDNATPQIMNTFYNNLAKGKTKSKALHNAKLDYIKNSSLTEASPHYWASFVLLGENNTIQNASYQWHHYFYIILLICFITIATFIIIKKKRSDF
jgi:CHAT domain-containing protein